MSAPHPSLYRRMTASVPIVVTVIVHVVLVAIAGYFVVSEQIIGKKNIMQAKAATESVAQKQVEHRLQIARKGGGSASSSPVSASRIFSTAKNALQMPAMPDLPQVGTSSLQGMGFSRGMGGPGMGTGTNTGAGGSNSLGRGFMSLSFLGMTNQRASRIAFIVDVGRDLLDIRKGGFPAFQIIREEIMKLISRLPPNVEFNVVLFEGYQWDKASMVAFDAKLRPATVGNKEEFFTWMRPINATPERIGLASAEGHRIGWIPKLLPSAGLDPLLTPTDWVRALQFVLEMQPDTVYIISGSQGVTTRKVPEPELTRRRLENEKQLADMKRDGLDPETVNAARNQFLAKASAELKVINENLKAAGKPPLIITNPKRIFDADFQAALKRAGGSITLDATGWANKKGQPIWWTGYLDHDLVAFDDVILHVSKLQRALVKDRANLNYFLFVGPDEKPQGVIDNLSKLTSRNGGKFELLTTRRLQEISAQEKE